MYETIESVVLYLGLYVLALWSYRLLCVFARHFFGVHAST